MIDKLRGFVWKNRALIFVRSIQRALEEANHQMAFWQKIQSKMTVWKDISYCIFEKL